jgi:DNA primase
MKGNYEPDKFTEADVLRELDNAGLRYKQGHRYILSQCPTHEDKHPSVQIYKDDWFVNCHAGCGRYHITKAFPDLRQHSSGSTQSFSRPVRTPKKEPEVKYKTFDLMEFWQSLPEIPADHYFKNIPIEDLNGLGWRWDAEHKRYFIPYFSRSKKTIPFAQWRNLEGPVRFNFWKDAKPTMYGTWNLEPGEKIFLVEGCSDLAVLDHCMVPAIATPSASQPELVKAMAKWCAENDVQLVYAGDRDEAGNKVREALDDVVAYRVRQPREPYKDYGDMFEAEGLKSVQNWCFAELFPGQDLPWPEIEPGYKSPEQIAAEQEEWNKKSDVKKVQSVFPGAQELKIVGGEKKQLETPPTQSF